MDSCGSSSKRKRVVRPHIFVIQRRSKMSILDKIDRATEAIETRVYEGAINTQDVRGCDVELIAHDQSLEGAVYRVTLRLVGGRIQTLFAELSDVGDVELYVRP
jgi:hypothetical protein